MSHLAQEQPRAGNYTSQLFAVGVHGKAAAIDAHLKPFAFARQDFWNLTGIATIGRATSRQAPCATRR